MSKPTTMTVRMSGALSDFVASVRIQTAASFCIDEIYRYTLNKHGMPQAQKCIHELFNSFEKRSANTLTLVVT